MLENAHVHLRSSTLDAKTKVDTVKYPLMTLSDSALVSESSLECKHQNASTNEFNFIKGSAIATSNKKTKKSFVSKTKESKTSSTGASKLSKTTLAKNDTTSAKKYSIIANNLLSTYYFYKQVGNATLCGDAARKEKFMRLLGAKKTGVSTTNVPTSDLSHDTESTQESLLKQFEKAKIFSKLVNKANASDLDFDSKSIK
ncbi:hypothetical protein BSLG_005730 [Batrachochytrium salamandrivorans]|nr:hypothetical protein BSLG_005730 [Batrachochytrium salamandrivorans]